MTGGSCRPARHCGATPTAFTLLHAWKVESISLIGLGGGVFRSAPVVSFIRSLNHWSNASCDIANRAKASPKSAPAK